jgi:hypothetical protein
MSTAWHLRRSGVAPAMTSLAFDTWADDCAATGLAVGTVEAADLGTEPLDTWLARLVEQSPAGTTWLAHVQTGRDERRYILEILGRETPSARGSGTVLALNRAEARLLIENGLSTVAESHLLLVDDSERDTALAALSGGDHRGALIRADASIVRGRESPTLGVSVRDGTAPAIAALLEPIARRDAIDSITPWKTETAPGQRATTVALVIVGLALAALAGSGRAAPSRDSGSTSTASSAVPPLTHTTAPPVGDVFAVAGVTLTPASASHGAVTGGQAQSIAYRDVQRRVGRQSTVVTLSSFLALVTGPSRDQCLCWVLRMAAVRQPPCQGVDSQEGLGYLVDAQSGLITEVVDVVVTGPGSSPCE